MRIQKVCARIDMSKAFDTVDRKKLIDILRKRGIEEENVTIIKRLLSQPTLRAKNGKTIGEPFNTKRGVPQGDRLSPRLFTLYLDEALREIDREFEQKHQKDKIPRYTIIIMLKETRRRYTEYAVDADFICDILENARETVQIAKISISKSSNSNRIYHLSQRYRPNVSVTRI